MCATSTGNVPPKADLGQLEGLEAIAKGATDVPMINGGEFDGAKAYKDSKVGTLLLCRAFLLCSIATGSLGMGRYLHAGFAVLCSRRKRMILVVEECSHDDRQW